MVIKYNIRIGNYTIINTEIKNSTNNYCRYRRICLDIPGNCTYYKIMFKKYRNLFHTLFVFRLLFNDSTTRIYIIKNAIERNTRGAIYYIIQYNTFIVEYKRFYSFRVHLFNLIITNYIIRFG